MGLSTLGASLITGAIALAIHFNNAHQQKELQRSELTQRDTAEARKRTAEDFQVAITLVPLLEGKSDSQQARTVRTLAAADKRLAATLAAVHPTPGTISAVRMLRDSGLVSTSDTAFFNRLVAEFDERRPSGPRTNTVPLRGPSADDPVELAISPPRSTATSDKVEPKHVRGGTCGMYRDMNGAYWCGGPCLAGQQCGRITPAS